MARYPVTASSYDIYWIAVHPDLQGKGLGGALLKEAERLIRESGGDPRNFMRYVPTCSICQTRAFYEGCGYRLGSVLPDFYAPGEGKAIYCKVFANHP